MPSNYGERHDCNFQDKLWDRPTQYVPLEDKYAILLNGHSSHYQPELLCLIEVADYSDLPLALVFTFLTAILDYLHHRYIISIHIIISVHCKIVSTVIVIHIHVFLQVIITELISTV